MNRLTFVIPFVTAISVSAPATAASAPRIAFDINDTIAATDVTTPNYRELNPDEKLIEARFMVSTRIDAGDEKELKEISIEIVSPDRTMRLVDFMPKTTLATDVDGSIEITEGSNKQNSISGSIKPQFSLNYKGGNQDVSAGISSASIEASQQKKSEKTQKYKLLPEKSLVLASGSTNRGHGAFFKLHPTSQTSIRGWKELVCIFSVDRTWRADWVVVSSGAVGTKSHILGRKSEEPVGFSQVFVGLYLAGDVEAKTKVRQLASTQEKHAETIRRQSRVDHDAFFSRMANEVTHVGRGGLIRLVSGQSSIPSSGEPTMHLWWQRPKTDLASDKPRACAKEIKDALDSLRVVSNAAAPSDKTAQSEPASGGTVK